MKKYCIYLDESGDFDSDLTSGNGRNGSLIGGVFWKKDVLLNTTMLENRIQSVIKECNHATELQGEHKGQLVYKVLTLAKEYPLEFVIFQNNVKKKIVNSTKTYLTQVTEGLVQLIKSLIVLERDSVMLDVVIGYKKDTTHEVTSSYVDGYIELSEYKNHIEEKFALEKAKRVDEFLQQSQIKIRLADDKRNTCLVLCDYVCNFWYTRQARAFTSQVVHNGREMKIRTALQGLYKQDYIFPLFISEENEHVSRLVEDGVYADALFEVCAGAVSEENSRLIRQSFLKLRKKQIHMQLGNLADYIGNLLVFRQPEVFIEKVLKNAEELYEYLVENQISEIKFYLDIKLYLLAYLNNTNRLKEMEEIFVAIEKDIARYTAENLDVEYLLIYYIRRAVYLQDVHRYEESCKICDDMELLMNMIEEAIRSNDCLKLMGDIKSEQMGKILGTKLQAQISLCYLGKVTFEEALQTSDKAIEQFTYPYDLCRQYQYRAELLAVGGYQAEAIQWLEKSFGDVYWKTYISGQNKTLYDVYNLLYVAVMTKEKESEKSVEIAKAVFGQCKAELEQTGVLADICRLFTGAVLLGDKQQNGRGQAILKKMIDNAEEANNQTIRAANAFLQGNNGMDILFRE